ncbi:DUF4126 domain-containing protein [Tengunoibacter tsumagoiensis]|uniref:Membrane protein n=1 Tax=Tengunoibacter tsumagoiensis TaxID=2014871 RepID=A0A401ZYG8_9CHLR|nr:DUF4126 domain-containing protein [Tengunoibacter tsumagoiensis]GCE11873.1 membrane protein [Tengunoibacter tsumagoiensis]
MDFGTSSGLAFISGINAYLPLLSLALAADLWPDRFKLNPDFSILGSPWVIAILAILTLADLLADKIPGVDHVWDLIHTVLRPAAGAIVSAAADPHATGAWMPVLLAVGAGLATTTHITKSATRVTSTVTTAGCGNIVLSIIEDIVAVIGVFLALLAPYIMVGVVILFVLTFALLLPRFIRIFKRRKQRKLAVNQQPPTSLGGYPQRW